MTWKQITHFFKHQRFELRGFIGFINKKLFKKWPSFAEVQFALYKIFILQNSTWVELLPIYWAKLSWTKLWRVAVVLWLRLKTHDREVMSSNPHYGDHFSGTINLDGSKYWVEINPALLHILCNPAKGRVDFKDGWLIQSSFITEDEMKACLLTRTKLPQKNLSFKL